MDRCIYHDGLMGYPGGEPLLNVGSSIGQQRAAPGNVSWLREEPENGFKPFLPLRNWIWIRGKVAKAQDSVIKIL
jgi:hypothetical protein